MGISREQALDCFRSDDLIGIGMEADALRRKLHPEGVVSYVIERTIRLDSNSTDGSGFESICSQVGDALELGGTSVLFRGNAAEPQTAPAADRTIAWFEQMFARIKHLYPSIWLHGLSAPELRLIAATSQLTLRDTIARLHDSGLDSIAGDGIDIAGPDPWIETHRTAHGLGMQTAAAIVFGSGESLEQRADCLDALHRLQDETGGFTAFIPLSFRQPGGRELDDATAVESLKALAISRMVLDNIANVQSNWATQGLKVRQMGLRFGGNDVGPVMLGNGTSNASEEDLRRIIRDAGFKPVQRDTPYRTMYIN